MRWFICRKLCISSYKDFLCHIFSFCRIAQHSVRKILYSIFISLDEHFEGILFTCKHQLDKLRAEGGNPFLEWQLPQAAISLKQGAGRLIRTETDRGVLMICDPRLTDKPYGRRIWQSLPPMRRTREVDDVLAFFDSTPRPSDAADVMLALQR